MTNQRNNRRRARRNYVTKQQLRRREGGFAPRGRYDPPRVVATPWNTVTLAGIVNYDSAGVKAFSVNNVVNFLKQQIGVSAGTFPVLIRFESISVWSTLSALVGTGGTYISVRPSDLIRLSPGKWLEDEGTISQPAHVHWVWPESNRQVIFSSTVDINVVPFYIDVAGAYQPFFHLRVLWRPNGGDPIPSYRLKLYGSDVTSLSSSLSALSLDDN